MCSFLPLVAGWVCGLGISFSPDFLVLFITGPGHGVPGIIANAYLEGTYSEVYPNIS
jgi:phosphoketolase